MFKNIVKTQWIIIFISLALCIAGSTLIAINESGFKRIWLIVGILAVFLSILGIAFSLVRITRKQRITVRKSYQYYTETLVSKSGLGLIIFDKNENIIWVSDFLYDRGFGNLIGKQLSSFAPNMKSLISKAKTRVRVSKDGAIYELEMFYEKKVVLIRDITTIANAEEFYVKERLVIAELDIDNYSQLQATSSSEDLFKMTQIVVKHLDRISMNNQFMYKQYTASKFFIITNQENLNEVRKEKFSFIDRIRKDAAKNKLRLTVSIGVGSNTTVISELQTFAREALTTSQTRGGDQATIVSKTNHPEYFGGKVEATPLRSSVKIKNLALDLSDAMQRKGVSSVIIHGHKNADLDAIGAALGIYSIAKTFKLNAYIANVTYDDSTKKAINDLLTKKEIEDIFIRPSKAKLLTDKNSITVIVDVNNPYLIEAIDAVNNSKRENVFIFDHHRQNQITFPYDPNKTYIDTATSSASEIVTHLIDYIKVKVQISYSTAQMLLNGIYLDTNNFSKTTSSSTFNAASLLESWGAIPIQAYNSLKVSEDNSKLIRKIIANEEEVVPGYFLATYDGEAGDVVVSKAADDLLRVAGRRASFVVAKVPGTNFYKMSARSLDINVQRIAERLGGGGHFNAAAVKTNEKLVIFKDNIIQTIVSVSHESNTD